MTFDLLAEPVGSEVELCSQTGTKLGPNGSNWAKLGPHHADYASPGPDSGCPAGGSGGKRPACRPQRASGPWRPERRRPAGRRDTNVSLEKMAAVPPSTWRLETFSHHHKFQVCDHVRFNL